MKVFISWSGKMSGELAKVFRDWLPTVIQAVKPYYSPDDITKGSRGNTVNAQELEEARVGLLCLTKENLTAPWIMFEAGALSKKLTASRVCPILFEGVETTDLQGPLVQFQASKFSKEEIWKVVKMINNELGDVTLEIPVLETVFEKWWPDLEEKVGRVLASIPKSPAKSVRKDRDLLEEVLMLTRATGQHVRALATHLELKGEELSTEDAGRPPIRLSTAAELIKVAHKAGLPIPDIYRVISKLGAPRHFIRGKLRELGEEVEEDMPF